MNDTFVLPGSKSFENDAHMRVGQLLKLSRDWHAKAWANPADLGPDSHIFKKCWEHFQRVVEYRTPTAEGLREKYLESQRLAWLACWRSQDFSLTGVERHHRSLLKKLRAHGISSVVDGPRGTQWVALHDPAFDEHGHQRTGAPVSHRMNFLEQVQRAGIGNIPGIIFPDHGKFVGSPEPREWHWCWFETEYLADWPAAVLFENCFLNGGVTYPTMRSGASSSIIQTVALGDINFNQSKNGKVRLRNVKVEANINFVAPAEFASEALLTVSCSGKVSIKDSVALGKLQIWSRTAINLDVQDTRDGAIDTSDAALLCLKLARCKSVAVNADGANIEEVSLDGQAVASSFRGSTVQSLKIKGGGGGADQSSLDFTGAWVGELTAQGAFTRISLSNCTIEGDCTFAPVTVGELSINRVQIMGKFSARNLRVSGELAGRGAHFAAVDFFDASFEQRVDFSPAVSGADVAQTSKFSGDVDFGATNGQSASFHIADFSGAQFGADANFTNRHFKYKVSFDRTNWQGVPRFFGSDLNIDTSFVGAKFDDPILKDRRDAAPSTNAGDSLMASYERAFRALKLKMEDQRARSYEAMFHRLELTARRLQREGVGRGERVLSLVYDDISGYGQSFYRPLASLGLVTIVLSVFYWARMGLLTLSDFGHAIMFSVTNILRPFQVASPTFERLISVPQEAATGYASFVSQLFSGPDSWFLKLLSVGHSLVSLVLVFLLLLALRRRFQISG